MILIHGFLTWVFKLKNHVSGYIMIVLLNSVNLLFFILKTNKSSDRINTDHDNINYPEH